MVNFATQQPPEQAVRIADVKATSPCRLLELSVKDFLKVLKVRCTSCKMICSEYRSVIHFDRVCINADPLISSHTQANDKEQNRNILASLAKTCDERKANARRIDTKQRNEVRRRSKCVTRIRITHPLPVISHHRNTTARTWCSAMM